MDYNKIPQDMVDALDEFDGFARKIIGAFCNDLDSKEAPPIYHYTNDEGLRGILESGQLWLTDIFSLNDPSELRHGFSHAVKILNDKASSGPPESQLFSERFANFHQNGIQNSAHFYVCSFSSNGNELGQWRAYADNGRGYALEFDGKSLEDAFTKVEKGHSTFPVTYNDAELIDIHHQLIENMFELISLPRGKNLEGKIINSYMIELSSLLSQHVLWSALFFKHEAYNNESEYRFLQTHRSDQPPPEMERRYRPHELVKYRTFAWRCAQPKALKKIIIGPAAERLKAKQFVEDCLAAFNVSDVEIDFSEIPYRALD